MAHGLKTSGLDTLEDFRKRVKRQYSLRRIDRHDHDVLLDRVDDLAAYVLRMNEIDPKLENDWKRII
jgi:hypothetical protein